MTIPGERFAPPNTPPTNTPPTTLFMFYFYLTINIKCEAGKKKKKNDQASFLYLSKIKYLLLFAK